MGNIQVLFHMGQAENRFEIKEKQKLNLILE